MNAVVHFEMRGLTRDADPVKPSRAVATEKLPSSFFLSLGGRHILISDETVKL